MLFTVANFKVISHDNFLCPYSYCGCSFAKLCLLIMTSLTAASLPVLHCLAEFPCSYICEYSVYWTQSLYWTQLQLLNLPSPAETTLMDTPSFHSSHLPFSYRNPCPLPLLLSFGRAHVHRVFWNVQDPLQLWVAMWLILSWWDVSENDRFCFWGSFCGWLNDGLSGVSMS